jgi:chemotaxis protein MotA
MAWTTLVGLILGFGALLVSNLLEGGSPARLINVPAAVIVFGGTIGTAFIAFPPSTVLGMPKTIMQIFKHKLPNTAQLISLLVELADKARRQGLLSLEEEEQKLTDPFMKKGLQLVVDGTDPETVRHLLETETMRMAERHFRASAILEAMGGYAPTMGIIGTVMGLVNVLSHAEDPSEMAASIATAFLATFYGVATANLLWLPLASKLKEANQEEVLVRHIMADGILAIQAGDNPRVVRTKLESSLPPKERGREVKEGEQSKSKEK